jgi:hypothetical protein
MHVHELTVASTYRSTYILPNMNSMCLLEEFPFSFPTCVQLISFHLTSYKMSMAANEILIKAVAQAILTYVVACFYLSKSL